MARASAERSSTPLPQTMKMRGVLSRMKLKGFGVESVTVPAASSASAFIPAGTSTP
ncbi:hypothetical protein GCM10010517_35280 [Streptosporangium fragile]|uniref:Uncharacterized protein n=1 Tax=Streptosporangium fragile TaxID=46186 RepID=A0ABP6IE25_9ACTN